MNYKVLVLCLMLVALFATSVSAIQWQRCIEAENDCSWCYGDYVYPESDWDNDYRYMECSPRQGGYSFIHFWGFPCRYDGWYGLMCRNY